MKKPSSTGMLERLRRVANGTRLGEAIRVEVAGLARMLEALGDEAGVIAHAKLEVRLAEERLHHAKAILAMVEGPSTDAASAKRAAKTAPAEPRVTKVPLLRDPQPERRVLKVQFVREPEPERRQVLKVPVRIVKRPSK